MHQPIHTLFSGPHGRGTAPCRADSAVLAAATDRPRFGPAPALIVLDLENLMLSARDLGMAIDFAALRAALLGPATGTAVVCHAVYTGGDADNRLAEVLAAMGWHVTVRPPIVAGPAQRPRRHCNSDTWFAFIVADLVRREDAGAVVLGTGDGQLGLDLARCLRALVPGCAQVMTLSLPGSTSHLLDSRRSHEIDRNLEIGRDVLQALG